MRGKGVRLRWMHADVGEDDDQLHVDVHNKN